MSDVIWYIDIDGHAEGPFSVQQLKLDERVTPYTYVWREGYNKWRRIKDVPELKEIFQEEPQPEIEEKKSLPLDDEVVLKRELEPPPYWIWFLVFLTIILIYYTFFS